MRKFLYMLGAATLAVLAVAGIGAGVLVFEARSLNAESRAFVDEAVPAIAAHWDKRELLARASPELREAAPPEKVEHLFGTLARLGPLTAYEGATGKAEASQAEDGASVVIAAYLAKARFRNGAAIFRIVLLKRDGHWMINRFQIEPAAADPSAGPGELRT